MRGGNDRNNSLKDLYWFNFVSHDLRLLPIQIDHFDKHSKDNVHGFMIQGPFGANHMVAAGTHRITNPGARKMGINLINVPDIYAGIPMPQRYRQIADWVWSRFIRVSPDVKFALFTHSDLIPTMDFDIESILDGKPVAAIAHINDDGAPIVPLTYFAVDVEQCRDYQSLQLSNTLGRSVGGEPFWIDLPFKVHPLYRQMEKKDVQEKAPDFSDGYQGPIRWEWCEPCFLHLTKLAYSGGQGKFHDAYNEMIERLSDVDVSKFTYRTATSLIHRPRVNQKKLNCIHRGNDVLETVPCNSCEAGGKTVQLKVYACAKFNRCTIDREVGYRTCGACDSYDEGTGSNDGG